ncbi:MAG: hypothetical protein U9N48_02385 [Euryarchaeota archaeon]|nr:hypothetical protein [Euryarchaeota archaeon]
MTCLKYGTSFDEHGANVHVKGGRSDGTVLFFSVDDQSNPRSTLREDLKIEGKICDLLIFYAPKGSDTKVLCLVELKGSDITRAVKQIKSTYQSLKSTFNRTHLQEIEWKAYVLTTGSSPRNIKENKNRLIETFDKKNCDISRKSDLTGFICG